MTDAHSSWGYDPVLPAGVRPIAREEGPHLLWLVLGGLVLVLTMAIGTFIVLASGDDEAPVVYDRTVQAGEPALVEVPG